METVLYSCKPLAEKIQSEVAADAALFLTQQGRKPILAVILVGNDPASEVYVKKKGETCALFGIEAKDFRLNPNQGFPALIKLVDILNSDESIDGILVQSPLPKGWDERAIQQRIAPAKDVDGFHPMNAGALLIDAKETLQSGLVPCTPAGVMEVLRENKIVTRGKHAVVIGRSTIVGKPMALLLLAHDATVTITHSHTQELASICRRADILVAAVGKKHLVGRAYVKPGAVLIDVGINREMVDQKSKLFGDIDTEAVKGIASFVTPVPGGIGPMTIALLLRNTLRAARVRLN